MVSERIYVLFRPFGRAFSDGKLWWYCSGIAIWDLVFVLTPFFKGCPVIFDYYSLSYVTECEHFFTFLFNDYNWVIPITCLFLNILIIFYVSYIRNKCQLNSDQMRRRREEKVMISQSIATTTFLITYEITEFLNSIFEKEYLALSEMAQRTIYYSRDSAVGLTCFFIYFVGTPAIRKIVIDKVYLMDNKHRIPIVYIYVMILSNTLELFIEVSDDVASLLDSSPKYAWIHNEVGNYSLYLDDFEYFLPIFLMVIMVAERFYLLCYPFGQAFSNGKLWFYCFVLAILTSLLCMAPLIAGCPKSYDFYTSTVIADCEPIITAIFYKFNGLIPLVCMILNIGLICHFSYKRRKTHSQKSSMSVAQRSREKTMYLQLILCTTILLAYTICARVIEVYFEEYMEFSESTRRTIDYMMNLTVCLRCFLIYFLGTPAMRRIVLDKLLVLVGKKKKMGNTVVIMRSRDQSIK